MRSRRSIGGRHAGTFGDFGAFSFYATKNVVTGEGGMVDDSLRGAGGPDQAARAAWAERGRVAAGSPMRASSTTKSSSRDSSTT